MSVLKSNLALNLFNQVLITAFPIFINIYLVRVLEFEDLGRWYVVNSAAALCQLVISSPHFWLIRAINRSEYEPSEAVFSGVIIYLLIALFLAPVYFSYVIWFSESNILMGAAIYAHLLFGAVSCEFYFQAFLKQRFLVMRRLITRSLLILLLILLVKESEDFWTFVALTVSVYVAEHLVGFFAMVRELGFKLPKKQSVGNVARSVGEMLPFNSTHNTLPHIVLMASPRLLSAEDVGILSVLLRLINMMTTVVTSSTNVIFPYLSSSKGSAKKRTVMALITSIVAFAIALLCYLFKDFIAVLFLNQDFTVEQSLAFSWLCSYIFLHSLYNYIVFGFFIISDRTRVATMINVSIIGFFLILILSFSSGISSVAFQIVLSVTLGLTLIAITFFVSKGSVK